jgi:response regulator RpfG family c-di-GMP phosphodiesterase
MPVAEAVKKIREESGRQFDPEVVATLESCWQELDAMCPA